MEKESPELLPVLVLGDGRLACSVALCLKEAGHNTDLLCNDATAGAQTVAEYYHGIKKAGNRPHKTKPAVIDKLPNEPSYGIALIIASENNSEKKELIGWLDEKLPPSTLIAATSESARLKDLQHNTRFPERICGLNWTEPAHTTLFLEIIINDIVRRDIPEKLLSLAKNAWNKDPYITRESGIRARLISAMAREAFYLIANGYASVEDIDRACRNDAGYYLPFAGNCRYMDLMGTRAYGMVMKDLNPDLCNDTEVPAFFETLVADGHTGMDSGSGLYSYTLEEIIAWKEKTERFSHQIRKIITRYPFAEGERNNINQ